MKLLEGYLGHIQGENEDFQLQEGFLDVVLPIGALIAYIGVVIWLIMDADQRNPKHPKWKKIWDEDVRVQNACEKHFPDSHTKVKAGASGGSVDAEISYEHYEQNPQRVKCQMKTRIKTLKTFIKWVSKEKAEEVCKHNQNNQYKCIYYVNRIKEKAIEELRELTKMDKLVSSKNMTKAQFNKTTTMLGFKKAKR